MPQKQPAEKIGQFTYLPISAFGQAVERMARQLGDEAIDRALYPHPAVRRGLGMRLRMLLASLAQLRDSAHEPGESISVAMERATDLVDLAATHIKDYYGIYCNRCGGRWSIRWHDRPGLPADAGRSCYWLVCRNCGYLAETPTGGDE